MEVQSIHLKMEVAALETRGKNNVRLRENIKEAVQVQNKNLCIDQNHLPAQWKRTEDGTQESLYTISTAHHAVAHSLTVYALNSVSVIIYSGELQWLNFHTVQM